MNVGHWNQLWEERCWQLLLVVYTSHRTQAGWYRQCGCGCSIENHQGNRWSNQLHPHRTCWLLDSPDPGRQRGGSQRYDPGKPALCTKLRDTPALSTIGDDDVEKENLPLFYFIVTCVWSIKNPKLWEKNHKNRRFGLSVIFHASDELQPSKDCFSVAFPGKQAIRRMLREKPRKNLFFSSFLRSAIWKKPLS